MDKRVQRLDAGLPAAAGRPERGALVHPALAADHPAHARELLLHAPVHRNQLVVGGADLAEEAAAPARQPAREVAVTRGDEGVEDLLEDRRIAGAVPGGGLFGGVSGRFVRLVGRRPTPPGGLSGLGSGQPSSSDQAWVEGPGTRPNPGFFGARKETTRGGN